jgi:RND family efflux transporter MFP subunit
MVKRALSVGVLAVVIVAALGVLYYGGVFGRPGADASPSPTPTATADGSPLPSGQATPRPTPTRPPTPQPSPTPIDTSVHAAAVVVPIRSADLAMSTSGVVSTIYVREGEQVSSGQLLLKLDQSTYLAQVDVAAAAVRRGQAEVDRAMLQIEQLPADATTGQIEAAQAELRVAQADLELARSQQTEAQAALKQTELRAPIAGTLASLQVATGEEVVAGQTIATVGDVSSWLIETTDVSELEIVRVAVGDRATITFNALPDVVLNGHVARIQVRGTNDNGEVMFAVIVAPDEHLDQLRWNMSATARIFPSL